MKIHAYNKRARSFTSVLVVALVVMGVGYANNLRDFVPNGQAHLVDVRIESVKLVEQRGATAKGGLPETLSLPGLPDVSLPIGSDEIPSGAPTIPTGLLPAVPEPPVPSIPEPPQPDPLPTEPVTEGRAEHAEHQAAPPTVVNIIDQQTMQVTMLNAYPGLKQSYAVTLKNQSDVAVQYDAKPQIENVSGSYTHAVNKKVVDAFIHCQLGHEPVVLKPYETKTVMFDVSVDPAMTEKLETMGQSYSLESMVLSFQCYFEAKQTKQ